MPLISTFYGIIIRMYFERNVKHHTPHLHAEYGDEKVEMSLDGEILAGSMRTNKLRMVQVWIDIHHDELIAEWKILSEGGESFRIKPLE